MPTKHTLATTRIPARLTAFLSFSIAFSMFICPAPFAQQSGDHAPPAVGGYPVLAVGSPAPDFPLPGVDGKTHSLKDYAGSKVLVIIFTCDHCPVAQMYEKRIKELAAGYKDRGVAVIAIMGNDPRAEMYSELGYTDVGDYFPDMKVRAAYRGFNFPYLYDGDTQAVARKYGPTATPHAFIFDQQRILR